MYMGINPNNPKQGVQGAGVPGIPLVKSYPARPMSQSYVSGRQTATQQSPVKETLTANFADIHREDRSLRDEDIQGTYLDHKDR